MTDEAMQTHELCVENQAEREGFEPSNPFGLRAFQARALGQTMRPLLNSRDYTVHRRGGQVEASRTVVHEVA